MKLSEYRSAYEELSGTASQINRTTILACIAAIWVIKPEIIGSNQEWPLILALSLILFCASLIVDLLQYLIQSLIIYVKYNNSKKSDKEEADFTIPVCLFWWLWGVKLFLSLVAFGMFAFAFCKYIF